MTRKKEAAYVQSGSTINYGLVSYNSVKDIYYYEGGWWMSGEVHRELERDRFNKEYNPQNNNGVIRSPRPNKETKEIELDTFILPRL